MVWRNGEIASQFAAPASSQVAGMHTEGAVYNEFHHRCFNCARNNFCATRDVVGRPLCLASTSRFGPYPGHKSPLQE